MAESYTESKFYRFFVVPSCKLDGWNGIFRSDCRDRTL